MSIRFVLKQLSPDSAEPIEAAVAEYVFDGNLVTVGSDAVNTIVLEGSAPEQAVIIREGRRLTLINGADGTAINNRRLRREAMEPLASGDEIKIGNYIIFVVAGENFNANGHRRTNPENRPAQVAVLPEKPPPAIDNEYENSPREATIQNGGGESPAKPPKRNFADMLNALRTEEDSFYFIVEDETSEKETRVPLEQAEMPIGLDAGGQVSFAADRIAALYAVVRKDWSGIVVESQRGGTVFVNDEPVKTIVRLRNGDCLTFNGTRKNNKKITSLKLHEPSSLVALESILETRSRNVNPYGNIGGTRIAAGEAENDFAAASPVSVFERDFFGYFSFFEVVTMAVGTLIGAVLIFLLLELMV